MGPFDSPYSLDNLPVSMPSIGAGAFTAGAAGVIFRYFAWADPDTGEVSNTLIPNAAMGLVMFDLWRFGRNGWNYAYEDVNCNLTLRAGMMCALATQGNFLIAFPLGARAGARVYANTTTGAPAIGMSGVPGYVSTSFTAMSGAGPAGLAYISSYQQSIS